MRALKKRQEDTPSSCSQRLNMHKINCREAKMVSRHKGNCSLQYVRRHAAVISSLFMWVEVGLGRSFLTSTSSERNGTQHCSLHIVICQCTEPPVLYRESSRKRHEPSKRSCVSLALPQPEDYYSEICSLRCSSSACSWFHP